MSQVFGGEAVALFAQNYPEAPHRLTHHLRAHELLTLEAIAELGEALPPKSVEYNPGDLPVGIDAAAVPGNGLSIGETIRTIDVCQSWAVLKNIEQMADYETMLLELLGELKPTIETKTGRMLRPQGFIFVSSPGSMTPYHFDPEHNILLQLRGTKTMTQFPAGDARFAPPSSHEAYHSGHQRNLAWRDEFLGSGLSTDLAPGQAVFVPVMAPHFVRNGPEPSISLSITWRSDWSFAEADAHGFNRLLRRAGLNPSAPGRFPASNKGKAYAYRALRKLGLAG
ncbi:transcriptional regulator [Novosphingopyxis sp.]|uniref:transcriptional regulator n=1 Tax=Novosphingopyxis sp. TaxID=2709690 RepID=UPI003B58DCA6